MLKALVVGCGRISQSAHLPALSRLQQEGALEIVGVSDLDPKRAEAAAKRFGVSEHDEDWEALARRVRPQLIAVCLPPGPNAEVATRSVEMGIHTICEKPPGRASSDAAAMAAAARERPEVVSMIAFNRRFAPLYRKAMEQSCRLGKPNTFLATFSRPGLGTMPSDTASDWITSDASHSLDLAVATVGRPVGVTVARHHVGPPPDNIWGIQLHGQQATAYVALAFAAGRRIERFEWTGPGYDVVLELPEKGEWAQQGSDLVTWDAATITGSQEALVNYGFLGEYQALVDAICDRGPRPGCDFSYGAEFMALVGQILACENGGTRRIDPCLTEAATQRTRNGEAEGSVRVSGSVAKPRVHIRQPASVHAKYFAVESLSRVAAACGTTVDELIRNGRSEIEQANVVITGWDAPNLPEGVLDRSEALRLVIVLGASVRNIHPEKLFERGVVVCNTGDAIAQSVAEHCMLLTLAGLRRLPRVDGQMHRGAWPVAGGAQVSLAAAMIKKARRSAILGPLKPVLRPMARAISGRGSGPASARSVETEWQDLRGQIVGLVGWGSIARRFAQLLAPYDCQLLVCSESASEEELTAFGAKRAELSEVLASSKVISLHKGMTRDTVGLLDASRLALIRPGTVLVNTARAALIEEHALLERLKRGDLVAALDVFHEEPLPGSHALRKLDNVILTPHMSNLTPECYRRVGEQALEILLNWVEGKPIPALTTTHVVKMT